jgi:hypothetical protein
MQVLDKAVSKSFILISVLSVFFLILSTMFVSASGVAGESDDAGDAAFMQSDDAGTEALSRQEEAPLTLKEIDAPIYEIATPEVPLGALPSLRTWTFANLLIALVCLIMSAVTIIKLLAERKSVRGRVPDEYGDDHAFISSDSLVFKLLGAGVGAASVVLFLLTENIRGMMQPVNGYTWLMILILLVQSAILFMAFGNGKQLLQLRGIGG